MRIKKIWKSRFLYYGIELVYSLSLVLLIVLTTHHFSFTSAYQTQLMIAFLSLLLFTSWLLPGACNRFTNFLIAGIYCLYLVSQKIYYRGFQSYYQLSTAFALRNEVLGAKNSAIELIHGEDLIPLLVLLGLTIVFIVVYFFYQRKLLTVKQRILPHLACLLCTIPFYLSVHSYQELLQQAESEKDSFPYYQTDAYIYQNDANTNVFASKFGLVTLAYKNIYDYVYPTDDSVLHKEEVELYLNGKETVINTNDYTSVFEGKNVLFVQAESFNDFALLDETLTPTLWKLKNEGISIEEFETPAMPGSTSDSEFMANTSLIPNSGEGDPVCYEYADNTYPTTLAKLFSSHGYSTLALHNNYGEYYNRDEMFASLGYDDFYDCTDLALPDTSTDTDVAEKLKYILCEADYPLMVYWITYSGHQPYDLESTGVSEENVEKIKELYPELADTYVSYLAKNMDLDQALSTIIEACEDTGVMDNLVIVFFGDHIVKGLEYRNCSDFFDQTGATRDGGSFNDTDLFIYATDLTPASYEKKATLLDMLPTIANLWNFSDYDETTVLGRDLFDSDYHGFYFSEYGLLGSNDYLYNQLEDSFDFYTENYDLQKAQSEVEQFLYCRQISSYILQLDYFKEN